MPRLPVGRRRWSYGRRRDSETPTTLYLSWTGNATEIVNALNSVLEPLGLVAKEFGSDARCIEISEVVPEPVVPANIVLSEN